MCVCARARVRPRTALAPALLLFKSVKSTVKAQTLLMTLSL